MLLRFIYYKYKCNFRKNFVVKHLLIRKYIRKICNQKNKIAKKTVYSALKTEQKSLLVLLHLAGDQSEI